MDLQVKAAIMDVGVNALCLNTWVHYDNIVRYHSVDLLHDLKSQTYSF